MNASGCQFMSGKATCRKIVDAGETLCPHHRLIVEDEKRQDAEKERAKQAERRRINDVRRRGY